MNRETLLKILDLARWAPSGDNTQPWRFEIVDDECVVVHGHDTRDEILYDFDGHASHMAHGALLETMRIAASAESVSMDWSVSSDVECRKIRYHVRFSVVPSMTRDPLCDSIEKRVVQRRPMRLTPLNDVQRAALLAAPGDVFTVQLFESFAERKAVAGLLWDNAYIRLTCPEAFPVHQSIIEWGAKFSKDRIPERAVGVDPLTAYLMRWVMQSWGRVNFFNRYLLGTVAPRIQLDYLPAILCAAHVLIQPRKPAETLEDWVELGGAMQRLWLTACSVGLHLQPEMTPVIFSWYAKADRSFSADSTFRERIVRLLTKLEAIGGKGEYGFFGRVGVSAVPTSRSVRLGLEELLLRKP